MEAERLTPDEMLELNVELRLDCLDGAIVVDPDLVSAHVAVGAPDAVTSGPSDSLLNSEEAAELADTVGAEAVAVSDEAFAEELSVSTEELVRVHDLVRGGEGGQIDGVSGHGSIVHEASLLSMSEAVVTSGVLKLNSCRQRTREDRASRRDSASPECIVGR
jgi:hypothetical protein